MFFLSIFAQEKKEKPASVWKNYQPNFMIGVDVLNVGIGFFSDRKLFEGYISTELKPKLHLVADAGFEKNSYIKNGYDVSINGSFLKVGSYYMLVADPENRFNGFYVGGKLAGSFYNQHFYAVPVRGIVIGDYSVSYPASNQSAFWVEGVLGARIQLFSSPFYIDANFQPKYMVYTTKQDKIQPMIVPSFGESASAFGTGFSWSIAYKF